MLLCVTKNKWFIFQCAGAYKWVFFSALNSKQLLSCMVNAEKKYSINPTSQFNEINKSELNMCISQTFLFKFVDGVQ